MKIYDVKEVTRITGLTRKQLFDYQWLVKPIGFNKSGYKQYDLEGVEKLKIVSQYRQIDLPLKVIERMINDPLYDKEAALMNQLEALKKRQNEAVEMIQLTELLISQVEKKEER